MLIHTGERHRDVAQADRRLRGPGETRSVDGLPAWAVTRRFNALTLDLCFLRLTRQRSLIYTRLAFRSRDLALAGLPFSQ